jgi:hypothetical protein
MSLSIDVNEGADFYPRLPGRGGIVPGLLEGGARNHTACAGVWPMSVTVLTPGLVFTPRWSTVVIVR